ncbi:uncharacterized protein LOC129565669 [Sitodiplosis mosellana]|uniref:uncharacterized protein LOC129565669 n=1 Tax=Sitodiplosis mosellana TaxID=263140 RepID=UPI002443FD56|nr:uncharacterized protein LOC129565669 [Sitodiplosis mosellana]
MEGGLMEVLSDAIREALFEVIEDLLKTENFKVNIEPGSKKGDNFIGIVYRIIFSTADKKRSSKLFLKIAPENEEHREKVLAHRFFLREIYVHNEVLPCFREFQKSRAIVAGNDGFFEYPQCYKFLDAEPFECLFLQDVTEKGFEMINKDELTVEHILLVMQALGKLHAISFAMKDQQRDKFSDIVNGLHEHFFRHGYNAVVAEMHKNAAINVINAITDEKDSHLLEAVLKMYEISQFDILVNCVDANEAEPYSVVIHGDMWSNNTMFKVNKQNKPSKVCIIDWQICRYSSPVLDIVYYIFLSTTRELRGRNYNIYLKTYHESLSNHLIRYSKSIDFLQIEQKCTPFLQ